MVLLVGFQRSSKDLLHNGFSFVYPIISVFISLCLGSQNVVRFHKNINSESTLWKNLQNDLQDWEIEKIYTYNKNYLNKSRNPNFKYWLVQNIKFVYSSLIYFITRDYLKILLRTRKCHFIKKQNKSHAHNFM